MNNNPIIISDYNLFQVKFYYNSIFVEALCEQGHSFLLNSKLFSFVHYFFPLYTTPERSVLQNSDGSFSSLSSLTYNKQNLKTFSRSLISKHVSESII